jgi:aldehyde dehydrogenase (NAD+)/betaine-aldehyde dehydrogenase
VTARYFEFYAATAETLFGTTLPSARSVFAYTIIEPHGVSAHIVPWNYPLQVTARTLAPALATGNACVLKPAEDAPLTPLRIGELALEAGFPPGVLNVVPGYGDEAGAALAAHPGIDHLSFTGSREVGELVMASAARNIVPVTLELGGKSPQLVFADADIDAAVPSIVSAITEHAGQNCSAGSRLLVHESVRDEVVARVRAAFEAMRIGPGRDDPDLGPLISAKQRDRVRGYIDLGRTTARLVTGGESLDDPLLAGGFFVRPTIFDDVPPDARIAQEEIFGPVLCVTPFRTTDEAVALANGTTYGLASGVWTRDVHRVQRLVRELRAGQVFVNNYSAAGSVELPFGGYGRSGFGREKGAIAVQEYVRHKAVAILAEPTD